MRKFVIKDIIGDCFILADVKSGDVYPVNFVFVDYDPKFIEGEFVCFDKSLVDLNNIDYSNTYYLGEINHPAGKIVDKNSKDLFLFVTSYGEFIFKRLFG